MAMFYEHMNSYLKLTDNILESIRNIPIRLMFNLQEKNAWNKMSDFQVLDKLILLEEFKNCIPECIVVYLNE